MKKLLMGLLSLLVIAVASAQQYELIVLDQSTNESGAYGINNFGYVAGYKLRYGISRPSLWAPDRGYLELATPGFAVSAHGIAYSINDYFDIGGTFGNFSSGGLNAYNMGRGSAIAWVVDLDVQDFVPYEVAGAPAMVRDININGEVAGQTGDYGYTHDIYNGGSYNFPYYNSYSFGINDKGNAVGTFMFDTSSQRYAPIYIRKETNGSYSTITSVAPFNMGSYGISAGVKINNSNVVVGISPAGGFCWEPETGSNTFLGGNTFCYGINDPGVIVGVTNSRACMWKKIGNAYSMTDLNKLVTSTRGYVLEKAFDINEKGQIVGQCLNTNNGTRSAYMLTPAKVALQAMVKSTNGLELNWISKVDHTYSIRTTTDLKTWESLPDLHMVNSNKWYVTVSPIEEKRFFRVLDLTP